MENRSRRFIIRTDYEGRLGFLFCIIVMGLFVRNVTYMTAFISNGNKELISVIVKAVILLVIAFCLPAIINRIDGNTGLVLMMGASFVIMHILIFTDNNSVFLGTLNTFCTTILPAAICVHLIYDYERFYTGLIKTAVLISSINMLFLLLFFLGNYGGSEYSMGYSQSLVFPTNVLISLYFKDDRKNYTNLLHLVLITANVLSIVVFGSRGAIVSIAFFTIIMFISSENYNINKKAQRITLIIFFVLISVVFSRQILQFAVRILNQIGMSSRTLDLLAANGFLTDNGRMDIWTVLIEKIKDSPFIIRGINADQLLQTGFYHNSNYAHNLFLELIYSFGIIIGGALSVWFINRFIKTLKTNVQNDQEMIRLLSMSSFFPICIWSGSLWTDMYCWVWLAIKKRRYGVSQ